MVLLAIVLFLFIHSTGGGVLDQIFGGGGGAGHNDKMDPIKSKVMEKWSVKKI